MTESNKINYVANSLNNHNAHFNDFIHSIKLQREQRTHPNSLAHSQPLSEIQTHSLTSQQINQRSLPQPHNESTSYASPQSFSNKYIPDNNQKYYGDVMLRKKGRFSVGNRTMLKQFELPSKCFNQTKNKIGEYFRAAKDQEKNVSSLIFKTSRVKGIQKVIQKQQQFRDMRESKVLKGEAKPKKMKELNETIILKYCLYNQLTSSSDLNQILMFFTRLLELLNYAVTLSEPKIQKYKDCVYFGETVRRNQLIEGILYFFKGVVYCGEMVNQMKHGHGIEIDIQKGAIYRGQFREGRMNGFFQVVRGNQSYSGHVIDGEYHGHGKLINERQIFEGEFRNGQKIQNKNTNNNQLYLSTQQLRKLQKHEGNGNIRYPNSYMNKEIQMQDHKNYRIRRSMERTNQSQLYEYRNNKAIPVNSLQRPKRQYQENGGQFDQYNNLPIKQANPQQCMQFSYPFEGEIQLSNPQNVRRIKTRDVGRFNCRPTKIERVDSLSQQQPLQSHC